MRVDTEIYIDDATGTAVSLQTNAVSARAGDPLLTLTGGSAGVRSAGAVEITGVTSGTEAVFPTSAPALAQHQRIHAHLHGRHRAGGLRPVPESPAAGGRRRDQESEQGAVRDQVGLQRGCRPRGQEHRLDRNCQGAAGFQQ